MKFVIVFGIMVSMGVSFTASAARDSREKEGANPLANARTLKCKGILGVGYNKPAAGKEVNFEVRPLATCGTEAEVLRGHEIWVEGKYERKANIQRAAYCDEEEGCTENDNLPQMDLDGTVYKDYVVDSSKHRKIWITDCEGRGPFGFEGKVPHNISGDRSSGATYHWAKDSDMPCMRTTWERGE